MQEFQAQVVALILTQIILVFLVKWAKETLDRAVHNEKESKELVEKMAETFDIVESSGKILDGAVYGLNNSSESVKSEFDNKETSIETMLTDIDNVRDQNENLKSLLKK